MSSGDLMGYEEFCSRYIAGPVVLGKGRFGTVYLGQEVFQSSEGSPNSETEAHSTQNILGSLKERRKIAIKNIPIEVQRTPGSLEDEIKALKKLGFHPNIVNFLAAAWETPHTGEKPHGLLIAFEFMNSGDIFSFFQKIVHRFPVETGSASGLQGLKLKRALLRKILKETLSGLSHMHSLGLVHKDIKPSNILASVPSFLYHPDGIDSDSALVLEFTKIKIADFGSTVNVRDSNGFESLTRKFGGSFHFMAPQCLLISRDPSTGRFLSQPHGTQADIWALGMMAYLLWTNTFLMDSHLFWDQISTCKAFGDPEFKCPDSRQLFAERFKIILRGNRLEEVMPGFPTDLANLISRCLRYNESDRPTAMELLENAEFLLRDSDSVTPQYPESIFATFFELLLQSI
jgi:serine/threonine protein kinase